MGASLLQRKLFPGIPNKISGPRGAQAAPPATKRTPAAPRGRIPAALRFLLLRVLMIRRLDGPNKLELGGSSLNIRAEIKDVKDKREK